MLAVLARLIIICLLFVPSLSWAISLQVKINGLDQKMTELVGNDLHLQQATKEPKLTVARIHNLYAIAENQIITTLQAKGYYHSTITHDLTKINGATPDADIWIASFSINLGQPTTIRSVDITVDGPGRDNPRIKKFLLIRKLVPGKILTHEDYEETKEQLLSDFNSIGYLKAHFTKHVIEVDKNDLHADIKIDINTGILFVFGKVTFVDSTYPNSLLDRYIPFQPGQAYETQQLIKFQQNLEAADLFSKIRFDPTVNLEDPNDNSVPVDVRLTLKPKNRYTGSIGFGTDTGPRASAGWLHRLPRTEGHRVLTNVTASKVRRAGKVNYIIPGKRAATDRYTLGLVVQEDRFDDLYSRKAEIFGNTLLKRGRTESLYGLNYFTETFRITPSNPKLTKNYLLPNAKWTWIDAYEDFGLEYGTRLELQVRAGVRNLLSNNDVFQTEVGAKRVFLINENMRFLVRANAGAVTTKDFNSLPPSLRFFTGGDDTVRGYAYNSLGPKLNPKDPNSDTIGGKYLFTTSVELEHKIYDKLSGVVFFDAGNASMKFIGPLARAPGFGIRYGTPIGNFRIDLAKPQNMVVNKRWRLHITFGTDL